MATAALRAPWPPAPRPACSGSRSAPAPRWRPPSRPSTGAAGLRVQAGHVARPPRTRRGCPPIAAAGTAGLSRATRSSVPASAAGALKSASQQPGSGLSWGAVPARPLRPACRPAPEPRPASRSELRVPRARPSARGGTLRRAGGVRVGGTRRRGSWSRVGPVGALRRGGARGTEEGFEREEDWAAAPRGTVRSGGGVEIRDPKCV